MTRVLVTGAAGLVGEAAARAFAGRGCEVWRLTRREAQRGPRAVVLDLNDGPALEAALAAAQPQIVVHAAGAARGAAGTLFADNALASASLVAALGAAAPSAKLILVGSAAQYGPSVTRIPWRETDICAPLTPYGISKLAGEQAALGAARRVGLAATSLRLFNVVAPTARGGGVVSDFLGKLERAAALGPPPWRVPMGPLGAVRDFVLLEDVVEALVRTAEREVWGQIVNVCSGRGRPAADLVGAAARAVGAALETEAAEDGGLDWSVGDPTLLEALLGFRPSAEIEPAVVGAARSTVRELDEADARSGA